MRTLKTLLSNDCKTFIVYSVTINPNAVNKYLALDWKNAVPVFETGDQKEALAFCHWAAAN
jgi:hypothetical protein